MHGVHIPATLHGSSSLTNKLEGNGPDTSAITHWVNPSDLWISVLFPPHRWSVLDDNDKHKVSVSVAALFPPQLPPPPPPPPPPPVVAAEAAPWPCGPWGHMAVVCLMLWKLMRLGEVGMDMARATRTRRAWLSCQRCHLFLTAERTCREPCHLKETRRAFTSVWECVWDDGWFMQPHPARGRLIGGWGGCLNQQSSTHTPTQTLLSKETYRLRSKNHQRMLNWKCYIQVSKTQLDKVQRSKSKTKS